MRTDFNRSLLNLNVLHSMLYKAGRDIVDKKISITELHQILNDHITAHLPVKVVRKQNDYAQTPGVVYVGGSYDSVKDNAGSRNYIHIVFSYHPLDDNIKISKYRWRRMCSLFADTVLHEVIHMRQYRSRDFKDIPGYLSTAHYRKQRADQEYYGDRDEMGAFSFNIACEMLERFGTNISAIERYLNSTQARLHKKSTYCRYLMAFDCDHNHPRMRQMKKKIIKQLDNAVSGKPFKTSNFLTY